MGYNTVAVLFNDFSHEIANSGPVGRRIAEAIRGWSMRSRDKHILWFGCGAVISQDHADYSQVVVVGQNRGRSLCECNDLDGYALSQLTEALVRHGYTVKAPKKTKAQK